MAAAECSSLRARLASLAMYVATCILSGATFTRISVAVRLQVITICNVLWTYETTNIVSGIDAIIARVNTTQNAS
jgi:hypothetical protein